MKTNDYIGQIGIYTSPETNYTWLVQIDKSEYKKCTKDYFKHTYLSGRATLLHNLDMPIKDIRTGIINMRTKSIQIINNTQGVTANNIKDLTSLFD